MPYVLYLLLGLLMLMFVSTVQASGNNAVMTWWKLNCHRQENQLLSHPNKALCITKWVRIMHVYRCGDAIKAFVGTYDFVWKIKQGTKTLRAACGCVEFPSPGCMCMKDAAKYVFHSDISNSHSALLLCSLDRRGLISDMLTNLSSVSLFLFVLFKFLFRIFPSLAF